MNLSLRRLGALFAVTAAAALASVPAHAGPYSSLTVFGDSLSDVGNIKLATGGAIPPAPYYQGRFSDGPIWIDVLAAGLGLPSASLPSLAGGSNYAFGGARTGIAPPGSPPNTPPGVLAQVGGMWAPSNPVADPNGLYVVVGGGNDMRDARSAPGGDATTRQAAAEAAALNIFNSVFLLASHGAQHVLISTLPDLGGSPEAVGLGLAAESTDATLRYNAAVMGLEALLESMFADLDVMVFDMYGVALDARNNPAQYGVSNTSLPCTGFALITGGACSVSLFSDALHPSALGHAIIGAAALDLVIPVPASLALLGAGLLLLGTQRRHRARAA